MPRVRAAQYLRMSTEHQRYSLHKQAEGIADYAVAHGYEIVRTYADPGVSGLSLKRRLGLQSLLADVLHPDRAFEAVLVLDVSRWGRYQDLDQAAHFEFVCRQAGVEVIYCAETFENDGSAPSAILKQLRRLMAAEYSRDLSAKVTAARLMQAKLGHHQGGPLIYGFSRIVIDRRGRSLGVIERRHWKAQSADHVVLAPGPPEELAVLRRIFRHFLAPGATASTVARELMDDGIPYIERRPWTADVVTRLLKSELMIGVYVFNRTSQHLQSKPQPNAAERWVRVPICDPIVPRAQFARAQKKLAVQVRKRRNRDELLADLGALLAIEGHLSANLIDASRHSACASTYKKAFGSLPAAYAALGYTPKPRRKPPGPFEAAQALEALRGAHDRHGRLSTKLVDADPTLFDHTTYGKHFGSLSRAYALAGLPSLRGDLIAAARRRPAPKTDATSA